MPKTAREIPIKEVLETVYPKLNLKKAGEYFGVGQTTMHKWLAYRGIERTKRQRVKRSEEWKKNKSEQMKGKSFRKKTGVEKNCVFCKQKIYVIPARLGSQKFCSNHCKSLAQRVPEKSKVCENPDCQLSFNRGNKTAQNFKRQKYCSKSCQTLMSPPPKFAGEQHPLWKGEKARRRNRLGPLESWRKKVLSRDKATCQICSQDDVKLVVHHIKPFETFPELRFDVKNGFP